MIQWRTQSQLIVIIVSLGLVRSSAPSQIILKDQFPNLSFSSPVGVYNPGDGTDRLFVVEQGGVIRVFENDSTTLSSKVFLDISDSVVSGGELGLLGLTFHPDYVHNGYFYVDYTRNNPLQTIIARFRVSASNADSADPASKTVLLRQSQPFENHNGGQLAFGPDGFLYIAFGDGGSGGDPLNSGQTRSTLLGKILRINVDSTSGGQQYTIPQDNPFFDNDSGFRPEIFAYGFRNPWRFSFDESGRLWVGDVGQNNWEEVDTVVNGGNYGWNIMEASHCYNPPSGCSQSGLKLPIAEYAHANGRCSITGGFVYRGSHIPSLLKKYLFADYCTGELWSLETHGSGTPVVTSVMLTGRNISSFGEDKNHELYICSLGEGKVLSIGALAPQAVTLLLPPDSAAMMPNIVFCRWSASQNATTYHLQVAEDTSFSFPVVNDSSIADTSLQIGPLSSSRVYYWRVRAINDEGASAFSPLRRFTTAATSLGFHVLKSWNLISLPLNVSDPAFSTLFPSAISSAFCYLPPEGYVSRDSLVPRLGYWIKFGDSQEVAITGEERTTDTINVVVGWNLIGALTSTVQVDSILQIPAGLLTSGFYEYRGKYQLTSTLEPAKGYWVKAGLPGRIILHVPGSQ